MKIKTTRLEIFSDGVIAIMITIMVLELKLPGISPSSTTADIIAQLKHLMPHLLTYAFSFMMIGIFWTNHHHMFHMMEKTDEQLLWMNFAFLFFLSLIPFATNLVGANPLHAISAAVYGIVMLMTSLSFLIMRVYTFRKKLMHTDSTQELSKKINKVSLKARTKAIIGTLIYLISIPLAFFNVYISYICLLIPVIIFIIPDGIDNERLAEKVEEKNS